jgi:putative oxidoreductase
MSIAFLIARLILGLGLAVHGSQKLFGSFGGPGIQGTGAFFESLGFRPGTAFAVLAGLGEFGGGLLVVLGLGGPIGPALMISVMLVAILTVHLPHGFLNTNQGWELPGVYSAGALILAFTGFGAYSLDRLAGISVLASPRETWLVIAVGVALSLAATLSRRTTKSTTAHPA